MHADVHDVLHDVIQTSHSNFVYMPLKSITTIKQVPYALAYRPCLCALHFGQMFDSGEQCCCGASARK